MIHPADDVNGYFVSFDEFSGVGEGPVHLVWHPSASSRTEVSPLEEYDTGAFRQVLGTEVGLSFFFGTPPDDIKFERGIIASASTIAGTVPEFFFNTYSVTGGNKRIATVLFPTDATHQKGEMNRVSGTGYSGAEVVQDDVVDTVLVADGSGPVAHNSVSFQGLASFYRKVDGATSSFFVRKGTSFDDAGTIRVGFESDDPISIRLNGTAGRLFLRTEVTLYYPGIELYPKWKSGEPVSADENDLRLTFPRVPTKLHYLLMVSRLQPQPLPQPSPTPSPLPAPTVVGINPSSESNDQEVVPFVVTGTNFVDGATVALTADGEVTINATGVLVNSETEIAGNFDLSDASPGLYDVVVTNPDDQSASLTTGFLITAAEEESLEVANLTVVSDTTIGEYEKFELAFSIEGSQATAPQFPYDPIRRRVDGSEVLRLM